MSAIVKSGVPGKVPTANQLEYGQLALNYSDESVYFKNSSNEIKGIIDGIPGLKNFARNPNFDIWQAGDSFLNLAGFFADRWRTTGGNATNRNVSKQEFTLSEAILYGSRYFARLDVSAASTWDNRIFQSNPGIELAGKTVTVSLLAKANTTKTLNIEFRQYRNATEYTSVASSSATLTTSWARYTFTVTIPNVSATYVPSTAFLFFALQFENTAGIYDFAQVQIELGRRFTGFQTLPEDIELARCLRYFYAWRPVGVSGVLGSGYNNTTTTAQLFIPFPTRMYKSPTLETSGTASHFAVLHQNATITCSALPSIASNGVEQVRLVATVASGLTVGQGSMLWALSTSAFLGFRGEV